jgi:hypothetical protein
VFLLPGARGFCSLSTEFDGILFGSFGSDVEQC